MNRLLTVADIVAWSTSDLDSLTDHDYDNHVADAQLTWLAATRHQPAAIQTVETVVAGLLDRERTVMLERCAAMRPVSHPAESSAIDAASRLTCDATARVWFIGGRLVWDSPALDSAEDLLARIARAQ